MPLIPELRDAEAGGSLISRPPWSTEQVPWQPGLYRDGSRCLRGGLLVELDITVLAWHVRGVSIDPGDCLKKKKCSIIKYTLLAKDE